MKDPTLITDLLGLAGFDRAVIAHRAASAARKLLNAIGKPEAAKPDLSKLTGLEKAIAAHKASRTK